MSLVSRVISLCKYPSSEQPSQCLLTKVFAEPGLLEPTEGSSYICLVVSVHKDCTGLQTITHMQCLYTVGSEDQLILTES